MHILLVEDDDRVAAALRPALHRHGIILTRLDRGRTATDHLSGVDVVLLDLGLPDIDGVDVCRAIRAVSEVPVIVVSARGEVDDRILGLHSGADDYLVKPYDIGELVARVHAVYRRRRAGPRADGDPEVVVLDEVTIDLHRHSVTVGGRSVPLTRKEFQVLALLASSGGAVWAPGTGSWPRCGAGRGPARTAPWTCTSPPCAPSSVAPTWCRPCAASATGSAGPSQPGPSRPGPTWTAELCVPECW
jgi:DNA-binding response OmpR family regulator